MLLDVNRISGVDFCLNIIKFTVDQHKQGKKGCMRHDSDSIICDIQIGVG